MFDLGILDLGICDKTGDGAGRQSKLTYRLNGQKIHAALVRETSPN